jgi:hypothetical protein
MVKFLVFSINGGESGFDLCRQNNNQSQFIHLLPTIIFAKVDKPEIQEVGIVRSICRAQVWGVKVRIASA